jgi:hypothetical protein
MSKISFVSVIEPFETMLDEFKRRRDNATRLRDDSARIGYEGGVKIWAERAAVWKLAVAGLEHAINKAKEAQ